MPFFANRGLRSVHQPDKKKPPVCHQSDAFGGSPVLQGGVSRSPDRPERPSGRRRIVRIWAGWCSPVQIFVRGESFRRTLDH